MSSELIPSIATIALCLVLGGILKGVTGAGAPIIAIPALVLFFDVRFAIVVMIVPNLLTNIFQSWKFRAHFPARSLYLSMAAGGVIGVLVGTYLLASLPLSVLPVFVAFSALGYVTLRIVRPNWKLDLSTAERLALPAGIAAGILQGASGLSAPVSITFLNAIRLPRPVFVATISMFFAVFSVFQLCALWFGGIVHQNELWISAAALLPISIGMPIGAKIAERIDPSVFDRVILALLTVIAVRLLLGFAF